MDWKSWSVAKLLTFFLLPKKMNHEKFCQRELTDPLSKEYHRTDLVWGGFVD